ncbi:MAG TPA: heme biosynthesis HemY N-terminal domain-containing protein [Methylibium sp.]|uniref:heme biosynthesis HemY N-terminal domain-containing protein n=1 Tax=Methylibium sp. TaxID=2067992 RepID=UPI002DB7581B|nr:heme biosynthesis HemY N-terminal domain-containing protein [Methylibium sp.]HEU4458569.1 heme biosynthesis HemY N-terminal domain-containing protein [Methylibium sp.]
MRALVWLLLLAACAILAATLLGRNDHLVTIYWAPWRLDLSFNLFLVGLIAFCGLLYALLRALGLLVDLPQRAREWRISRRDRIAQSALREALAQYFGGRWARAEKAAQRAVAIQSDTPELKQDAEFAVLGHLLAAGSLHRLQDRARRDRELALSLDWAGRSPTARAAGEGARLLAAEWALEDRDALRALELIEQLPPGVARRTQALRLKLQATRLAREPIEALKTARLLAKHQAFSPGAAQGLLRTLAVDAIAGARDADQLRAVWREFDPADRRDVIVATRASAQLLALGAPEEARAWLRPFWERITELPREERDALAIALARATRGIPADWLPRLEAAQLARPQEGALAWAMARALLAREIWGKASQFLQQAADSQDLDTALRREAWLELATLAERERDDATAARCYRAAACVR